MGRSRIEWAAATFAPWALAFELLVSITARADPDLDMQGLTVPAYARLDAGFLCLCPIGGSSCRSMAKGANPVSRIYRTVAGLRCDSKSSDPRIETAARSRPVPCLESSLCGRPAIVSDRFVLRPARSQHSAQA